MKNIEIKLLNEYVLHDIEKTMVCAARLTQRGHTIETAEDFSNLFNKSFTQDTLNMLNDLPHSTIQRFGVINVAVIGASRRFLAQITRHQVGVTFMSASLQYSDYSGNSKYVVPYEIITADCEKKGYAQYVSGYHENQYIKTCEAATADYEAAIKQGIPHDAAAYMQPHGLRNILIISGNVQAFKYMFNVRTCRRNSPETRYVMLRIWALLQEKTSLFDSCGPSCITSTCNEGSKTCGTPLEFLNPVPILKQDFKYLY